MRRSGVALKERGRVVERVACGRPSFSEEKEAKRLYPFQSLGIRPFRSSRRTKVFCFFFPKKKAGRRPSGRLVSAASQGFTLLEALVALAIAGIGLAVLLGGTGTGVGSAARAGLHARALSIAQSQMASLEGAVVPPAGEAQGDVDGFSWTTRVGPVAQGASPNTPSGALLSLDVAVRRHGVELAHLSGRRIGPYGGGG